MHSFNRYFLTLNQPKTGPIYFALLSALMILMLFPIGLTGNEENYFQLAYRTISPEKFTEYHAAFDQSKARFATEYLFGSLVYLFGYEIAHAVARICMTLFYAAGLTYFFRSLRLSVLDALLAIVLFDLAGEHLMGGEWLFYGVESKTLAYAFLLFAFGSVNHDRWRLAIIAGAAATYMHFLVGGFWTLVILLLHWYRERDIRSSGKAFFFYSVLILPLLYLIAKDQLIAHALPTTGLSADKIYAEIRNPHHIAPFSGSSAFWTFWVWLPGLITTASLAVVMSVMVSKEKHNLIALAALIGLVELMLAMLISYLDRNTLIFAKLYLFRPSSLTLFFVIVALLATFKEQLSEEGQQLKALLTGAITVPFCWWHIATQIGYYHNHVFPERQALVAAINQYTKSGEIVLIEPYKEFEQEYLSLHRDIDRPTLVSWKFVPTNPPDILRWYALTQLRKRIFEQGCPQQSDIPIRWLIALHPKALEKLVNCGPVVWHEGNVALIEMNNSR